MRGLRDQSRTPASAETYCRRAVAEVDDWRLRCAVRNVVYEQREADCCWVSLVEWPARRSGAGGRANCGNAVSDAAFDCDLGRGARVVRPVGRGLRGVAHCF